MTAEEENTTEHELNESKYADDFTSWRTHPTSNHSLTNMVLRIANIVEHIKNKLYDVI